MSDPICLFFLASDVNLALGLARVDIKLSERFD